MTKVLQPELLEIRKQGESIVEIYYNHDNETIEVFKDGEFCYSTLATPETLDGVGVII